MFLVSSCSCLYPIHWSQVLSGEWRCRWSITDRRCSNYIWVMPTSVAYIGCLRVFVNWKLVISLIFFRLKQLLHPAVVVKNVSQLSTTRGNGIVDWAHWDTRLKLFTHFGQNKMAVIEDNIFLRIFFNEYFCILIEISLRVLRVQISVLWTSGHPVTKCDPLLGRVIQHDPQSRPMDNPALDEWEHD